MDIEQLLDQYFEGRTTADEERMLRRFFSTGDIPEHLRMYKPLIAYFEDRIDQLKAGAKVILVQQQAKANDTNAQPLPRQGEAAESSVDFQKSKRLITWLSGIAASAAILVGVFIDISNTKQCPVSGNYVMIDGRCYTDAAMIRSATLQTLHEMAVDDEFLLDDKASDAYNMVENQLKQFNYLLDE